MRKGKPEINLKLYAPVLQRENSARCVYLLDPEQQETYWNDVQIGHTINSLELSRDKQIKDQVTCMTSQHPYRKTMYFSTSHNPTLGTRSEFRATDVWRNLCYTT